MKAIAVVCLLAVAAVALATETETDEGVPTLPGLGSPCLPRRAPVNVRWQKRFEAPAPKTFRGQCVREAACGPLNTVHGYCAGIGVVCCKGGGSQSAIPRVNEPSLPSLPSQQPQSPMPARPNLQATPIPQGPNCVARRGVCKDRATCARPSTTVSGLCPGTPAAILCCVPPGATPPTPPTTGGSMASLIPIPAGINAGLNFPSMTFQQGILGRPTCPMSASCFSCACAAGDRIMRLVKTVRITENFQLRGVGPFVDAVKRAFDAMATGPPEVQQARRECKTQGALCCRPIKKKNGQPGTSLSNHSWGMAVDLYFGAAVDPRGDRKTQRGLAVIAPYLNAQKLYWAAGYAGDDEDAMHFEASTQVINQWRAAGQI